MRDVFAQQPRKQQLFMQVMMGFQSGILDTVEVMEHVSALLQGHWALLKQFNQFLPDGHRIEQLPSHLREYDVCHNNMQPVAEPQAEELAWQFFDKLQARFKDSPAKFKSIMRVLLELPSDGESFSKAGTVASEEAA
jgi:histone deacetylase complex regulatory component SIN3